MKELTNEMKVLHLTLKKQWFDMVADTRPETRKDEEYRELKVYWLKRLLRLPTQHLPDIKDPSNAKHFDAVCFKNGYSKDARTVIRECKGISIGIGKDEWGASGSDEFIIKLGSRLAPAHT